MSRPLFLFVHGWAGTPRLWDGVCAALMARGVAAGDMVVMGGGEPGAVALPLADGSGALTLPSPDGLGPLPLPLRGRGAELCTASDIAPRPLAGEGGAHRGSDGRVRVGIAERRPIIGVGHSLGAAWLLSHGPALAGFVAINGFTRFSSAADFPAGTPGRVLATMRRRLLADPAAVLADFHARAGLPLPAGPYNADTLAQGLDLLGAIDARRAFGDFASPHLALCGDADAIVPAAHSAECFPDPVMVAGAGHGLPVTHPALCADHILALAARC